VRLKLCWVVAGLDHWLLNVFNRRKFICIYIYIVIYIYKYTIYLFFCQNLCIPYVFTYQFILVCMN
jgi:hypothetical protein